MNPQLNGQMNTQSNEQLDGQLKEQLIGKPGQKASDIFDPMASLDQVARELGGLSSTAASNSSNTIAKESSPTNQFDVAQTGATQPPDRDNDDETSKDTEEGEDNFIDPDDGWQSSNSRKSINQPIDPIIAATPATPTTPIAPSSPSTPLAATGVDIKENQANTAATEVVQSDVVAVAANAIATVKAAQTRPPLPMPPAASNQAKKPNRRKLAAIGVVVMLGLGFCAGVKSQSVTNNTKPTQKTEPAKSASANKTTHINTGDPYNNSLFGIERRRNPPGSNINNPGTTSKLWPQGQKKPETSEKVETNKPPSFLYNPTKERQEKAERRGFVVALNDTKPESEQPVKIESEKSSNKNSTSQSRIAAGTRLPLMMLEPFRSGISATVTCQLLSDITDAQGEMIPAGSQILIPLLPFEVNGRVVNDSNRNTFLILPNGTKIAIKGTIKGQDGFVGLTGKVKKVNGSNIISRIGRGLGRVAGRTVSVQTGGYDGGAVEGVVNDTVPNPGAFSSTGRVVEIKAGTKLIFNVAG